MKYFLPLIVFITMQTTAEAQKAFDDISAAMAAQSKAWNTGDLNGFMDSYWKSDSLRFIGKRGVTLGWDQTLKNYQKSYPDKAAMGTLTFKIRSHEHLGKKSVLTVGEWKLTYPDGKEVGGYYTLIWKRFGKEWKIILDHTS